MKECPACGKAVVEQDAACPWCHTPLGPSAGDSPARTSGKAIASLILGIPFFFLLPSIAAVVLGHLAKNDIRRSGGRLRGKGLATGGLVLGYFGLALIPLLIIAAIAVPNLMWARGLANEASAIGSLRALYTASTSYASTYHNGYPPSLAALEPPAKAQARVSCDRSGIIAGWLASGRSAGYVFSYVGKGRVAAGPGCTAPGFRTFEISADPIERDITGKRSFLIDASGVIHYNDSGAASTVDPALH
jgi:type II secretory pathway pseudopilin PulG